MKKAFKKRAFVSLFSLGLIISQSLAEARASISNHVTAYEFTRNQDDYSINGHVINVADKAITQEIKILDEITAESNTIYNFTVWMVHADSNTPVAQMLYESAQSQTGLFYFTTRFNIVNKPASDYYIIVREEKEGMLGKFLLRIK